MQRITLVAMVAFAAATACPQARAQLLAQAQPGSGMITPGIDPGGERPLRNVPGSTDSLGTAPNTMPDVNGRRPGSGEAAGRANSLPPDMGGMGGNNMGGASGNVGGGAGIGAGGAAGSGVGSH